MLSRKAAELCANHCTDRIRIAAEVDGLDRTFLWIVAVTKERPKGCGNGLRGANAVAYGVITSSSETPSFGCSRRISSFR